MARERALGPALSDSRLLRFIFFGVLYMAQGIPWGFITKGYEIMLVDVGLSNAQIGSALGLAYLPWSFKLAWGPLLDLYRGGRFGRRRPFIVGAELAMGATLLGLFFCDPTKNLSTIGVLLFLHNTVAALQDVAVDGLAVDVLPEDERGRANSIMWAGKLAGVAIGGAGGLLLAKKLGWSALFIAMAAVLWLIMLLPLLLAESSKLEAKEAKRIELAELKRSFSFAAPLFGIVIALVTPAGYALVGAFTTRMMRADLKLDENTFAALASLDPIAGVAGAMLGGFVSDTLGSRRTMALFMAAIGLTIAAFALEHALWPSFWFLAAYTVVLQVVIASYSVASLSFFMTLANPAIGATHFSVYMSVTNLCYSYTAPTGGRLADRFGYVAAYFIAAAVQITAIPLLLLCNPKQAEERFRSAKPAP